MAYAIDASNEPQLLLYGRLVSTGTFKNPRKDITDIASSVTELSI